MARTFEHNVSIELLFGGNASEEVVATIEFTATPVIPATWHHPAEGGEVEVQKIVELFLPEKPPFMVDGRIVTSRRERQTLECPAWLEDMILASVSDEDLFESADFNDDYPDYD